MSDVITRYAVAGKKFTRCIILFLLIILFNCSACVNKTMYATVAKRKLWFSLKDFKNLMISRYSMPEFCPVCGGSTGFVNIGNLISMPITNKKIMLTGVFCLNSPITGIGIVNGECQWRVITRTIF